MVDSLCYSSIELNKGDKMERMINHDVSKAYEYIKQIIDAKIRLYRIEYEVCNDAPNKYEDMVSSFETCNYFKVFGGGDHGHLGREYNIKFRALHDYMHYTNELSFSFADEKQLSMITQWEFMQYAYNRMGLTQWETYCIGQVIKAEIQGQIEYYEKNNQYVKNQTSFVLEYLGVA